MELANKTMHRKDDIVYLSRYEVIRALLKSEEEENEDMSIELNVLLNDFCIQEHSKSQNISVLPFKEKNIQKIISYISALTE